MSIVVAKENSSKKINFKNDNPILNNLNEEKEYLLEEIKELEKGKYSIVTNWEDVEIILECFDDNEEFEITDLKNGMFAMLPTLCLKKSRKEFDELKNYV